MMIAELAYCPATEVMRVTPQRLIPLQSMPQNEF